MTRFGFVMQSAYTLTFHTYLFALLPPSFAQGFKALCAFTLPLPSSATKVGVSSISPSTPTSGSPFNAVPIQDEPRLWASFETLGLIDRHESLVASVGYEHIEAYVLETCRRKWDEPMFGVLREWMTNKIVPWMILPYARGATNSM